MMDVWTKTRSPENDTPEVECSLSIELRHSGKLVMVPSMANTVEVIVEHGVTQSQWST